MYIAALQYIRSTLHAVCYLQMSGISWTLLLFYSCYKQAGVAKTESITVVEK